MRRTVVGVLTATTVALGLAAPTGASDADATPIHLWNVQPVITHLNEPRGLSFDGQVALYVAQAGRAGSGKTGVTSTGAISKYRWTGGTLSPAWSTAFTSVYAPAQGGGAGTDVLGPAAVSAPSSGCRARRHDGSSGRDDQGCLVQAVLNGSQRGVHARLGLSVAQIGHLFDLSSATGRARSRSDIGDRDYAWTAAHASQFAEGFPDADPDAVVSIPGLGRYDDRDGAGAARTFVADAAANTISEVLPGGRSRVISYIPNETTGAKRGATPACIAEGPDGNLYVGTLDLQSNATVGPGQSNVWRVDPNSRNWKHNATLWTSGFTTINGCAFDSTGHFWASELYYPNFSGPAGDLAYVSFTSPDVITHVVGNHDIALPGGIAQGPDGAMYVSTGSADTAARSGTVVRVSH